MLSLENAFLNVRNTSREFRANADAHEKLAASLLLIEQTLFPERFEKKENEEVKD